MAVDRPTFSESWHRVAHMRPRLRSHVQVQRQHFRGRLWYVLRDPANNRYFRLDESAHHFIGLLDSHRTVAEAWQLAGDTLGDRAPTQGEAIQLMGQLYTANLLAAEVPADAAGMFERQRKRVRRETSGYLMNLLFARIPIFDPDRMLDRWVGVVGWVFSPVGLALWLVLIACGLWTVAGEADRLFDQAQSILAPANLVWLTVCFWLIKAVHELGHGFAAKKFGLRDGTGGEVHTIGIMLLVLMPVPYVDASSAWALRSKWKRAVVGAAGMYVELAVAAVAAIVWARTAEGTNVHAIAYNLILIASVSTILFNGNPLIRFDGYYILSDLLETPNLNQRSKEYFYYLVKKYVYGVRNPISPAHSRRERFWMVVYCVSSTIYRVFIGVAIVLYVAGQLFFFGALLAAGAVVGWLLVPIGKFLRYLAIGPELARVRTRALLASVIFFGGAGLGLGTIPVPERHRAEGVVEPREMSKVHAGADGFVAGTLETEIGVTGDGPVLVETTNLDLTTRRQRLDAERRVLEARYRLARAEEPAAAQIVRDQLRSTEHQIARVDEQLANLNVRPPRAGTWIAFDIDRAQGSYLRRGEPIGVVATLDDLVVRVVADQYVGPRVLDELALEQKVQMRVRRRPDSNRAGRIERMPPAGGTRLPTPALGFAAGGAANVRPDDRTGTETTEPFFEIVIRPDPNTAGGAPDLWAGQRVVVRFEFEPRPVLAQVISAARQLLQRRLQI